MNEITNIELKVEDNEEIFDNKMETYLLPNNNDEIGRLHKQHLILRSALKGNYVAPVIEQLEKGITVLDSGCGPGSWTLDMAQEYPNSKFHGVDFSSNFINANKPGNCEFVLGNITERIPYPDNHFDYVHQRLLSFGLSIDNWNKTLKEIMRVLKPGGYIELVEGDFKNLYQVGPLLNDLQSFLCDMFILKGMPIDLAFQLDKILHKNDFVNIATKKKILNLNHSSKAGHLLWEDYYHVYYNIQPVFAKANAEWEDKDTFREYLNLCGSEAKDLKTGIDFYSTYAQKPF